MRAYVHPSVPTTFDAASGSPIGSRAQLPLGGYGVLPLVVFFGGESLTNLLDGQAVGSTGICKAIELPGWSDDRLSLYAARGAVAVSAD